MEVTSYNIVDSLKFAFTQVQWRTIETELWKMEHIVTDKSISKMERIQRVYENSQVFNAMPHCTVCLITDCFHELYWSYKLENKTYGVYGFGRFPGIWPRQKKIKQAT